MKKFEVVIEYRASKTLYVEAENRDKAKEIAGLNVKECFNDSEDFEITNCVVTDSWEQ